MKLLSSIDRAVPERFLAPSQLNELIEKIKTVAPDIEAIYSNLEEHAT
jgi:hypothetical protein